MKTSNYEKNTNKTYYNNNTENKHAGGDLDFGDDPIMNDFLNLSGGQRMISTAVLGGNSNTTDAGNKRNILISKHTYPKA
jgi:hypothetical protein